MLIGEVAARSGISARMLRHYDSIGLVSPTGRTLGGYRQYSDEDVRRLFHVEGLRSLGLSLQDVADVLGDLSFSPAAMVEELVVRTRDRIAREEELLRRLGRVQASDPAAWSDVLRTVELVRGLDVGDPSARQRFALSLTGDAASLAEAALNEPDPHVAGALDWALARTGDGAVPALAAALDSVDAGRRHRALAALVKIGSPQALAVLGEASGHSDPLVRGRIALARGARGEADTVPVLVTLVVEGRDDVDAADVLTALASHHGRADAIAAAIAAELPGATGPARRRLAGALAEIPGRRARATLTGLLDDPDAGVAHTATFLLRRRAAGPD
ncbi:MerR family transcriptional regulator [Pseudonocardia abyssalis]|uniref:MerR family transcriptional regulator n=1 Tax=Pseudonocardia abyssalis TaxID=2792008 RepID=A0ABS6UWK9_9PSEU|nr:MerR family transcriptional regulator [Pseudonocardia abyssalis]MBW0114086.1 MerR family transcriptional regulator [Pseudonocardia abyssalis]MBW0136645.1 MerR family transcriptional regulator [Pseudonocardia abyssalis]